MHEKTLSFLKDDSFLEAFAELTNEQAIEIREAYNNKDASTVAKLLDVAKWKGYTFSPYCLLCLSDAMKIAVAVIEFRENPQNYGY